MESKLLELQTFGLDTLPTLDVAVLGALELLEKQVPVTPNLPEGKLFVVGSVNAAATGRIVCTGRDAVFADESNYRELLERETGIKNALLISASGGKHAVEISKYLKDKQVRTILITHNDKALATQYINADDVHVFPKNREPYTYNTSTYLGTILAFTKEDAHSIRTFIENVIAPAVPPNLGSYDAFFLTVPSNFHLLTPMLLAKFDELLAPRVSGRVFTEDHAKHATTVIPSERECFISFGTNLAHIAPPQRLVSIPVPENAGYAALMAITYYVIGAIQKQHPPYFQQNIVSYCERASKSFNQTISPIVD